MLCSPNIFKLEPVLHFEKDFKKHGIEGFYRKGCYISRNYFHGNTALLPDLMLNQSFFSNTIT
jgi:hypothetical protein